MTTSPKRPPLARKHTSGTDAKRDEALDTGVRLTIDGEVFEARVGDVTSVIARELRQASGMSFMKLINTVGEDPDIDVVSAFVWVARRIKGEQVAFDDVSVSYSQMLSDGFDVAVAGAEEVDENPEA